MSSFLFSQLADYIPPRLQHNALGWHVEYYVRNPLTEKLERKRFRLNALYNQCANGREFHERAQQVLQAMSVKLNSGWTPVGETTSSRYYLPLFDALDKFLSLKANELRPDSMRTYKGLIKILKEWLKKSPLCIEFDKEKALEFMDYCYVDRKVSSNTYNTYLKVLRVIFSWLQSNLYIKENVFASIKRKRAEAKFRQIISVEDRCKIAEWCDRNYPGYKVVCSLIFFSLVRPTELTRLQIKHLRLADHCICLPEEVTKCHIERFVALEPSICEYLKDFTAGHGEEEYLFGGGFKPGKRSLKKKMYIVVWDRMRNELGFPLTYQLYSLRDSGITAKMEAGMDAACVMHAAGHHDLSITTKYLSRPDKSFIDKLINLSPSFAQ